MRPKIFIIFVALAVGLLALVPWHYRFSQPSVPLDGAVHLKFEGIEKAEYGYLASFSLQNGGPETLYYAGYSKDDQCSYKLKHGETIAQENPCWCGTGLAERQLEPGEAAIYKLDVTRETGKLQVGFDFHVGASKRPQTIWSQEFMTF